MPPEPSASRPESLGLYLHIPFCRARCSYCDFNTSSHLKHLQEPYFSALATESSRLAASWRGRTVETIYIGGGTPTSVPPKLLLDLLDVVFTHWTVASDAEVTVEANPGTVDATLLRNLSSAGVNRLSLGAQSFQTDELALLGRIHTVEHIAEAVQHARSGDMHNVNLDLIYGLPHQHPDAWVASLRHALTLTPQHLSLYALSVEDGTPLHQRVIAGELPTPDADLAAGMYETAEAILVAAGYCHYELSNWALSVNGHPAAVQQTHACRHNLRYWRIQPYIGLGAGAHSHAQDIRYSNVESILKYIAAVCGGGSPVAERVLISPSAAAAEGMILGLRLLEGIDCAEFEARYGSSPIEAYPQQIAELVQSGLIQLTPGSLMLTVRGRLLANQVFGRFWPPPDQ